MAVPVTGLAGLHAVARRQGVPGSCQDLCV